VYPQKPAKKQYMVYVRVMLSMQRFFATLIDCGQQLQLVRVTRPHACVDAASVDLCAADAMRLRAMARRCHASRSHTTQRLIDQKRLSKRSR
jgi:hypothetical protein